MERPPPRAPQTDVSGRRPHVAIAVVLSEAGRASLWFDATFGCEAVALRDLGFRDAEDIRISDRARVRRLVTRHTRFMTSLR
jgi:hypothetical protein